MTFDEAKKLKEYNFKLNGIERLIDDIRNNYMRDKYEDGERYIGVAVLEIGYIDIEVNVMTEEQVSRKPHPGDETPVIDYFICLKNDKWESEGYLDYNIQVDWNADDWKEQLEKDMFQALDEYVKKHGFHYDQPNYGWMHKSYQEHIAKKNK